MSVEVVKECTKCRTTKSASDFCKDKQKKDGLSSHCRACRADRHKESYPKAREGRLEYVRNWYQKNRDAVLARNKAYAAENKEKRSADGSRWYKRNAERLKHLRNERYRANPDLAKSHAAKRRAVKRMAGGTFSQSDVKDLFVRQKMKCAVCHESIKYGYHVDHIQPLCLGGDNSRHNIQLLCRSCNLSKAGKDPVVFMQQNGRLL